MYDFGVRNQGSRATLNCTKGYKSTLPHPHTTSGGVGSRSGYTLSGSVANVDKDTACPLLDSNVTLRYDDLAVDYTDDFPEFKT